MSPAPSGTVTFLFTDIQGSTRRWEQHPQVMGQAVGRHDGLMRAAIEARGGHVFKTVGDAFCAVFATPHAALGAALAAQEALLAQDWSAVGGLAVRMALHTGVAEERGGDYFGAAVNRVARLLSAGHGGQVLLSGVTRALVADGLPEGTTLADLGSHRLQDLGRPEEMYQLRHAGLPDTFPALRTLASFPNNLPHQLSSFVGREAELAEVGARLEGGRLLTLTGIGGTGKTRLALQAALEMVEQYADGVWWVGLAPLRDPGQVVGSVATELGIAVVDEKDRSRRIEDTLVDHLRSRQLLLLLDNCEHLLDSCRYLATRLLMAAPGLRILATSREALGVSGETVWPVPSLSLPVLAGTRSGGAPDLKAIAQSEAVHLFLDRAGSVKPDFRLTVANAGAILEICRRLDGNPLAVELAATRVVTLAPQQIAERLEQRFRLLTGGSRTALPRQQTLRAALDWSHDLLDERERRLFRRLSVFAGGWTMEAAEAVCADEEEEGQAEPIGEWDVLDLAGQLVSKSLVSVDDEAGMRQWMPETIHEYAAEHLSASGEQTALGMRRALHFLALAEATEPELTGPRLPEGLRRLDEERANLMSSLSWLTAQGHRELSLRLGGALWRYWYLRAGHAEGRQALERALARIEDAPDSAVLAKALHGAGTLATFQGDFPAARAWLEAALTMWRALGKQTDAMRTLNNLAILNHEQGDYRTARVLFHDCLEGLRDSPDRASLARAHTNVATVALELGQLGEALRGFQASLAIHRQLDNPSGIAEALREMGATSIDSGDLPGARQLIEEALAISRELGDKQAVAEGLGHRCDLEHRENALAQARATAGEWLALEREMGNQRGIALALGFRGAVEVDAGEDAAASADLAESRAILEVLGHRRGLASTLGSQGRLALRQGDVARARELFGRSLALRRAMGSPLHLLRSFEALIGLALADGRPDEALRLAAAAAALRDALGLPLPAARRAELEPLLAQARSLSGPRAGEAWDEGWNDGLEAAVARASALVGLGQAGGEI